ncbi:hypothetical protein [Flavisolibacter nicotianae]|uniref:hypothetical protein n=1 Tax=Flavisolibacter nicotianae TaxID=2364882 RepID=UPI000EAFD4C0|nr:hypothetical protein [Flavisolibacter nicotianae]
MACEFSIPFSGAPEPILAKARTAVQSQGGNFDGDTNSGDFDVSVFGNKITGNYTIAGQTLNITITDKPFLVPCSAIESFLKGQLQ